MKALKTKRFRTKDGSFYLTGVIKITERLEDLPNTKLIAMFSRRDLIYLQRVLRPCAFKRKITKLLDSLTKSRNP